MPVDTKACIATLTTTCQPGAVVSQAMVRIVEGGGPIPPPPTDCNGLANLSTGIVGQFWTRVVKPNSVKFGDNTIATNRDPTDYISQWAYPGTTPQWPGGSGLTTRPTGANKSMYFSEKFVVTAGVAPRWAWVGSGNDANTSFAISACAGDFGQVGSQITTGCKLDMNRSTGGLRVMVNDVQQGTACTLKPGSTYYLNLLPQGHLPTTPTAPVVTSCNVAPCSPWVVVTN